MNDASTRSTTAFQTGFADTEGKRCDGWFESSDAALGRLWSMSIAKGTSCTNDNSNDGDEIKRWDDIASGGVRLTERSDNTYVSVLTSRIVTALLVMPRSLDIHIRQIPKCGGKRRPVNYQAARRTCMCCLRKRSIRSTTHRFAGTRALMLRRT
jgi:hypothetical protein